MAHHLCPDCGGPLRQIHRRALDRLVTLFYRAHRYRCSNADCGWEGLLHQQRHKAKKKQPQWYVWVVIIFLGIAIGVLMVERLSTPLPIKTDVSTSP